jgi:cation-transporting ATPase 13A1
MELSRDYTLCVPGKAVTLLSRTGGAKALQSLLPFCSVFARTSPDDKEIIVKTLKDVGHTVLMCGDGTNDVGALKTAHVGIALLNSKPIKVVKKKKKKHNNLGEWIESLEEEEEESLPVVTLGDASIASPFTSRFSLVSPCVDIVKQGRSTLVTYLQMFKILGINCLSSAYSMSVMYLNGVKLGDTQATISGVIIALLFMFLSNSSPHAKLSSRRPHSKVFCTYFMVSMLGQFLLHFLFIVGTYEYSLTFVQALDNANPVLNVTEPSMTTNNATEQEIGLGDNLQEDAAAAGESNEFTPDLVNTVAFLVNFIIQLSTFAVNYVGEPFNVSIWKNRGLIYGLVGCFALTGLLVSGVMDELNETFELVPLPESMKVLIAVGGVSTLLLTMAIERGARRIIPEKLHKNLLLV